MEIAQHISFYPLMHATTHTVHSTGNAGTRGFRTMFTLVCYSVSHHASPIFFFRESGISGGGGRGSLKATLTES